jgi:methylated-DNA-[protein]-cysteine S-methyltransferase
MQHTAAVLDTPIGKISLHTDNQYLLEIQFRHSNTQTFSDDRPLTKTISKVLLAFFKTPHRPFDIPLKTLGTDFQKRVWRAMSNIPAGEVRTYQDLANLLQTSPRAIGNACRANPIPLLIPCHRVVAKNGLGGFSGKTKGAMLSIKEWLLNNEQNRTAH